MYQANLDKIVEQFEEIEFTYLPRDDNQFADALAKLSSMLNIPNEMERMNLRVERREEQATIASLTTDPSQWQRSLGYYWTTMETDYYHFVKTFPKCQIFSNLNHLPPSELYTFTSPWPFSTGGIDIIGKIIPTGVRGHEYVLVAIDYFTKWVEACSFSKITAKHVAKFLERNIFYRYEVLHELISDQGSHCRAEVQDLLEKYRVKHHKSSPYRPKMNGAVESTNKKLKVIIEKMADNYKDWPNKLYFALWGYRNSIRTSIGVNPYSLVYGMEAVQPVELEIPSLRIVLESKFPEAEWVQSRYDELTLLDERRLRALHHMYVY
ncbi:uncharacterized protein [Spinacia oleracea]|uniref:Integrase catalytic domain-containing protein n=1 Tax=Spinacia oleracea TaxID=3562 RepID=A0ABM3RQR3_SPIOL|nr:uncharacterized protein LOC130471709 [Spinacia oleracea]